jgi:universal stress protein A
MSGYNHILVPTDLSENVNPAARQAKEIATLHDAKITLLHIINYLPPGYVSVELPAEFASKEFLLEKAKKRMAEWADSQGLGDCEQIIETGQPKKIIVNLMEQKECDLVVLAPHDESGFTRFFGSVTNAVAQSAKSDVLIVRPE